jgi:hypothetical protein
MAGGAARGQSRDLRAASQASKAAEWLLTRHADKAGKNAGENATGEGMAAA